MGKTVKGVLETAQISLNFNNYNIKNNKSGKTFRCQIWQ